jgi:hypothetical protein
VKFFKLLFIASFLLSVNLLQAELKNGQKVKIIVGKLAEKIAHIVAPVSRDELMNANFQYANELFHKELREKSEVNYLVETVTQELPLFDENALFYRIKLENGFPAKIHIVPEAWLEPEEE